MLKWFSQRKTSKSAVTYPNQENEDLPAVSPSSDLTDADYEFLFDQLLDGVAHGWNQRRIIKFFDNLGTRGEQSHWVAWLEKFATKIPDVTNDSQRRLGAVMLRLAEVTQSAAELDQLSAIVTQLGKKLFFGNITNLVWEYDGLDVASPPTATRDNLVRDDHEASIEENMTALTEEIAESAIAKTAELDNQDHLASPLAEESTTASTTTISESSPPENSEATFTETQEQTSSSMIELVESWFNLGLTQANAGDLSGAIDSWHKALEINPNLAEIWHNLGSALGRLGNYPEAIESFNHALEIDPQSEQAWNDRAHAFYQMQQWENAIASWQKAIAINPENHQFWYHQGCALEQLQRLDDAIVSYAKALEISPNFEPARTKYVNLRTRL